MNKITSVIMASFMILIMTAGSTAQDQAPDVPEPGIPFDIELGTPVAVVPGESVELVTPNGISISLIPGESLEINITSPSSNPFADDAGGNLVNIFISIETNSTEADVDATIAIPYDSVAGEVDNPENLELAFYNESTEQWEAVQSTVDENAQVASANVDHFSVWSLVESDGDSFLPMNPVWVVLGLAVLPVLRRKLVKV